MSMQVREADRVHVLATLNAFADANIQQDRQTLTQLLHDEVSYGHTSGEIMTKPVTIEYILGRDTLVWRWDNPVVTIVGDTALVRGTNIVQIRDRATKAITGANDQEILWVLVRGDVPLGWQILARQNFVPRRPRTAQPAK